MDADPERDAKDPRREPMLRGNNDGGPIEVLGESFEDMTAVLAWKCL